jgi:putative ABC transport system permease protein
VLLNGQPYTVLGVMSASVQFPERNLDYWTPMRIDQQMRTNRGPFYMSVFGRMKTGVSVRLLQQELDAVAARLEKQHTEDRNLGLTVVGLQEELIGHVKKALWILMGAVFFVLLIACANVAGMLAARAVEREREISIRTALGAGRRRVLAQLLTETLLLFVAGGVVGLVFGYWTVRLLVKLAPAELAMVKDTQIDLGVVAFTLAMAFLTALIFGLGPALQATRAGLAESLKQGGRSVAGHFGGHLFRRGLVVAQIALAVILLAGGGLLIRSFIAVQNVEMGFDSTRLLTARLQLPRTKYRENRQVTEFFHNLIERIQNVPGVQSAGAIQSLLLGRLPNGGTFTIEGRSELILLILTTDAVTPDYFKAMGIRLLKDGPSLLRMGRMPCGCRVMPHG